MASYQGPNVSVRQEFETTPGAVAVESLPSVAVATAYDVYKKKSIDTSYGIQSSRTLLWGTSNKVVYDEPVAGRRAYDFFPPKAYANSKFGNIDLGLSDSGFSSTGIVIGRDDMYTVPGTEKVAGSCQAIVPYYKAIFPGHNVTIPASSLNTVIISNGDVVSAQIKPGQQVFISTDGGGTYTRVGVVGSIGTDKTKIYLAQPYTSAITTGDAIIVGGANSSTLIDYCEVLYDPTADFVLNKVAVGDVIEYSTNAIPASLTSPRKASVTAIIDRNTLRFNASVLAAGSIDSDFSKYFPQQPTTPDVVGSTFSVYSYSIKRLLGFSQNYQLKLKHSGAGVVIQNVSTDNRTLKISKATVTDLPTLNAGDIIMINPTTVIPAGTDERTLSPLNLYKIKTITYDGSDLYTITTEEPMYQSGVASTVIADGNFLNAWSVKLETEIVADFRAIRAEEKGVVKRITSVKDIRDAWVRSDDDTIDPRNELAFMMNTILARSGGKVCYGVNVDSSAANMSTEYAAALEELKLYDVYSHCFGTTDASVNSIVGPYCDEQADPYEGHERIGIICYDLDDIYLMGSSTGSIDEDTGVITGINGFNLLTAGVTVNDTVSMLDSDGAVIATAIVIATPTSSSSVATDYTTGVAVSPAIFRFESGRKDDQAIKGGSIKYGNRRVTMLWPGWFSAYYNNEQIVVPPYFIAACICGMDSGIIASQSFTNMPFSIPGLTNYQLNTSNYFRKAQLDEIGGGGVDIMIQDGNVTQAIKSRHDLTTNMDAVQYRERSITKQADVSAKTIRSAFSPYVGRYNITDNLLQFLGQVGSIVCTTLVKKGIIKAINVDKIERDSVIDDKLNIYITATAFIAGNYYDITLLIKTR